MIVFNQKEIEFLELREDARIATSHNDISHVKPVSFVFLDNVILVVTDYNTRTFTNVKLNPHTSIVIDIYKSGNHKAICIQGQTEIIENGLEFKKFYDIFYKKFEWVRKEPWKEDEAPFLKIVPNNKVSWGLN
ncbi:MAG: pyridoxamine 5'-phosphate oxidase family protein [Nitrosopumilus sp.]|nr:pyridoxamine 5'-phosphate oxidase family protein [Nitrosopumilus sp.]